MAALAFNGQEFPIAFSCELQNFELPKGSGFISESCTDVREPLKLNDPQSKGSKSYESAKLVHPASEDAVQVAFPLCWELSL